MGDAGYMTTEELCNKYEDMRLLLDGNPNAMIKGLKFHAHASFDFHGTRKVCKLKKGKALGYIDAGDGC